MLFDKLNNFYSYISKWLWTIFVQGLATILPLALTVALFNVVIRVLRDWLAPLHRFEPACFKAIPFSEIILAVIIVFGLGFILRLFVLKPLIHVLEGLIFKIPLIRPVYSGIKQLVEAFSPSEDNANSFKTVVLVEFPRKGAYSVGFLTSELPVHLSPNSNQKYYNIFIPTTPNPTTGFLIIVPESEIIVTAMNRQSAMTLIISGGIIQPEKS